MNRGAYVRERRAMAAGEDGCQRALLWTVPPALGHEHAAMRAPQPLGPHKVPDSFGRESGLPELIKPDDAELASQKVVYAGKWGHHPA